MPKNAIQKRLYGATTVNFVSGAAGTAGTNADTVDGLHASATATAYTLYPLNASALFPSTVLPTDVAYLDVAQAWTALQTFTTGLLRAVDISPSAGRVHTVPDVASDTFALLSAAQTLSNKTLSSATLTTPTISDFTNATHTHANAAGGGATIAATLFSGIASVSAAWTFNAGLTVAAGQSLFFGGDVALARKSANVLQLASGDSFQSPNFNTGFAGWNIGSDGAAEFNNVRVRGEFHASTFSVNEIHATGGSLLVLPAYSVYEDVISL